MKKIFYIVFRTKNGNYRSGRKHYPSEEAARTHLEKTGNLSWKRIERMP